MIFASAGSLGFNLSLPTLAYWVGGAVPAGGAATGVGGAVPAGGAATGVGGAVPAGGAATGVGTDLVLS